MASHVRPAIPSYSPLLLCLMLSLGQAAHGQMLQVSPQILDLGPVKIGQSKQGEISLKNLGQETLDVMVDLRGGYFTASPKALHMEGGEGSTLTVGFTAREQGEKAEELILQVKSFLKTEVFTVALKARGVRAAISIAPDPAKGLDMGSLGLGEVTRRTVKITNPGSVPLLIDSLFLARKDPSFRFSRQGRAELAPGQEMAINLEYKPVTQGLHEDYLILLSRDLQPQRSEMRISGVGTAPRAVFSPLPAVGLDFDQVEAGTARTLRLTILNEGDAHLAIERLEISGQPFHTSWKRASAVPISPGERQDIGIVFRPNYQGIVRGKLTVRTNDPERPEVDLPLIGEARISPPITEILNGDRIDFGNVAIGKHEKDDLLLWNRGGTPFTVQTYVVGDEAGEFEVVATSVVLQPGTVEKIGLRFRPKEIGERVADLVVETEAGERHIEIRGIGNFLKLSPSALDFGRVAVGETINRTTEILNVGNADFTVNRVGTSKDDFTVYTHVDPSNAFLLTANGSRALPLNLTFSPSSRGDITGTLHLEGHWEKDVEDLEILLHGTGVAAEIELHPSGPLDFGHVVLGGKATRTLVALNIGNTELQVEAHPESQEAGVEPSSFVLKPEDSIKLQVYFTPLALGERYGNILLISNDVKERALPLNFKGMGVLESIDLTQITTVLASRKSRSEPLKVAWNNVPIVVRDEAKIDVAFHVDEPLRKALVGRKIRIEWVPLDRNYDPKGSGKQCEVHIYETTEEKVVADELNLRLLEASNKRVRLKITTRSYPGAPPQSISQILEAGGWKWEFEIKPLVSLLTIRPGRKGGKTERLIGLPGLAFAGWHNADNRLVSGLHLTAIGNVLEALSSDNSLAISLGVALSFYKDKFLVGFGWDIYDHRPKDKQKATEDYIVTIKLSGLF